VSDLTLLLESAVHLATVVVGLEGHQTTGTARWIDVDIAHCTHGRTHVRHRRRPAGWTMWPPDVAFLLHSIYAAPVGRKPKTAAGEQVHNRLQAAREARVLSRQDLADAVGVHYQTVGYLERGEYSPSLVLALRIADTLGLAVEELFSLDPFPDDTSS
jgi:DNA-binding XRE family transcriptional regulator